MRRDEIMFRLELRFRFRCRFGFRFRCIFRLMFTFRVRLRIGTWIWVTFRFQFKFRLRWDEMTLGEMRWCEMSVSDLPDSTVPGLAPNTSAYRRSELRRQKKKSGISIGFGARKTHEFPLDFNDFSKKHCFEKWSFSMISWIPMWSSSNPTQLAFAKSIRA